MGGNYKAAGFVDQAVGSQHIRACAYLGSTIIQLGRRHVHLQEQVLERTYAGFR